MIASLPGDIFSPGEILNNTYEIEGVLGRGGTGEVYRARNTVTGQTVAIKALNKQFSGSEQSLELMRREAQMRDVRDDAVVRYSECSRSDKGHIFLVMDYIDGPSVADVMAQRGLDSRELLIIADRVAQGLSTAHSHGIVHRDLSPDNIILRGGQPERATLIDFGIAKDTAAGARTIVGNDFAGKYEYASPEQLEGRAEVRSDLYSLGATLLAAFRGRTPFEGALPGEMIRRKQSPLDTEGVPEPLKGLIDWMTQPKATDRPASAEAVMERLSPLLQPKRAGGRDAPVRGGTARPSGQGKPRGRGGAVAAAVVAVLAAAGAGVWYSGAADALLNPLPLASPYTLTATGGDPDAAPVLSGNAPNKEEAASIAAVFAEVAGVPVPPDAITLAKGVPDEGWTASVSDGLAQVGDLEAWRYAVSDKSVTVEGIAPNAEARPAAEARLKDWAGRAGFDLALSLATGPMRLTEDEVRGALAGLADCGPLRVETPERGYWDLGETVRVTGFGANPGSADAIAEHLRDVVGDRRAEVATQALNPQICQIRAVLPEAPDGGMSIAFFDGKTGAPNASGVYHPGDNPVVEILVPEALRGLYLTVAIIDNESRVYSIIPNYQDEENRVDELGKLDNGVRRIRVLHSLTMPYDYDRPKPFGIQVDADNFGKQEFIAMLTKTPFFDPRLPAEQSVDGFRRALETALAENPDGLAWMVRRVLETRP